MTNDGMEIGDVEDWELREIREQIREMYREARERVASWDLPGVSWELS